jgi:hypothetical protein
MPKKMAAPTFDLPSARCPYGFPMQEKKCMYIQFR